MRPSCELCGDLRDVVGVLAERHVDHRLQPVRGDQLAGRVPTDDVTDLVTENADQLGLAVRGENEAGVDVDATTGRCEGVHGVGVVDDEPLPLDLPLVVRLGDQLAGERLDVELDGRVLEELRVLFLQLLMHLQPELEFLVVGDQRLRDQLFGVTALGGRTAYQTEHHHPCNESIHGAAHTGTCCFRS